MQLSIHRETKPHFDTELNEKLSQGWKVVPGTYSVASRPSLGWNHIDQKHNEPIVLHDFFIVVEKPDT